MLNKILHIVVEPFVILVLALFACVARFSKKAVDIGIGPLPLINNVYHKKVFEKCGYSVETFVVSVWYITDAFDVRWDQTKLHQLPYIGKKLNAIRVIIWMLFRYRCLVIYFNGTTGFMGTTFLWRVEPFLLKLANVKTIVLPYGSDVQVMSRAPNLLFKDVNSKDYPTHRFGNAMRAKQIDLWTSHATHVVGGCEWVYYMYHWDTLMISHFSIDTDQWIKDTKTKGKKGSKTLRVMHAPNHRSIKGTPHLIEAVEELQKEGHDIELVLAERMPNHEVRALMETCDIVVDQLIVGWYAMFAIEAMALEKPVVCYLREDLEELFRTAQLYDKDEEIPLINASALTIKDVLAEYCEDKTKLKKIGKAGREYVLKHHSLDAIAEVFSKIAEQVLSKPS